MNKFFLLIFLLSVLSSCDKTEDTIANIKIRDANSIPVAEAIVRLFSQPEDSVIELEMESNSNGVAVFDLSEYFIEGQFGLFVLNIEVEKDTLSTNSIIQVLPEEVNEVTVILN